MIAAEDPAVRQVRRVVRQAQVGSAFEVHQDEPGGVPDLVAEVPAGLGDGGVLHDVVHHVGVEANVLGAAALEEQAEPGGVGAVLFDQFHRVDAGAEGLAHAPSVLRLHGGVDEHGPEGGLVLELHGGHDHPRHPEVEDVASGDHQVRGVEVAQVLGLLRPAERSERPEGGGEPGVEHVGVLLQAGAPALGAGRGRVHRDDDLAARLAGPDRDAMPPPDLPGDAPVPDVFEPVDGVAPEPVGDVGDLAPLQDGQGMVRQVAHAHEPLLHGQGLDDGLALVVARDHVLVIVDLDEEALVLKGLHDGLPAVGAVHPGVGAGLRRHPGVQADHLGLRQAVALPHLVVVGVVGGRDLHGPAPHLRVRILVRDDGDEAVHQGQADLFAHRIPPSFIRRMHGHAGVPQHRLGAGRGHDHVRPTVCAGVADVPEVALRRLLLHLQVGDHGLAGGAPVDHPPAPVDPTLLVKSDEGLQHGAGVAFVQGKPLPAPVVAAPQGAELLRDEPPVLLPPGPYPFEHLVAAQVKPVFPLLFVEQLLHPHLRGDAGVVRAGQGQRDEPLHPLVARDRVVDGVLKGVAHVELAGDVGGRDGDGEARGAGSSLGPEVTLPLPEFIPARLDGLRVIDLVHLDVGIHVDLLSV